MKFLPPDIQNLVFELILSVLSRRFTPDRFGGAPVIYTKYPVYFAFPIIDRFALSLKIVELAGTRSSGLTR